MNDLQPGNPLNLRSPSLDQLRSRLVEGQEWTEEERRKVGLAHDISELLFRDDTHRDAPYQYHNVGVPLRVVDRAFMNIPDAALAQALVMHDNVEDHAEGLIDLYQDGSSLLGNIRRYRLPTAQTPIQQQRIALRIIEDIFGDEVSGIVTAMTNPPSQSGARSEQQKILDSRESVYRGLPVAGYFLGKLADVTDHSADPANPGSKSESRLPYFSKKNWAIMEALETGLEAAIQNGLPTEAITYFYTEYDLARQRWEEIQLHYNVA